MVKAADGKTDLWGVLYKPYDFDPNNKYPVVERTYPGPTSTTVRRGFYPDAFGSALAQLGFITFRVDGRGTTERGKAFQDVIYWDRGHQEIPDHAATVKQLAENRPYMDLNRVGIHGHSMGGYTAIRALLVAPDVYHVGVASAPVVDLSEQQWHEWYMGLPQENAEGYAYASNLRLAGNLEGKLLLIHGTSDTGVPFSATMKMVEALIQAGKPYDLIVLPEEGQYAEAEEEQNLSETLAGGVRTPWDWLQYVRFFAGTNRPEEATAAFRQLEEVAAEKDPPWFSTMAIGQFATGNPDSALALLERAVDVRDRSVLGELTYNPLLYGLHDDPRFQALRERVGLPAVNQ